MRKVYPVWRSLLTHQTPTKKIHKKLGSPSNFLWGVRLTVVAPMRLIVVLIIVRSAKYCNLRVRVSACQSVSLSARISQKLHVHKVPWDARERRSCSSGYWQIALLRLQVRRNAQEERWAERYGNGCVRPNDNILCKIIDDSCLLQARGVVI